MFVHLRQAWLGGLKPSLGLYTMSAAEGDLVAGRRDNKIFSSLEAQTFYQTIISTSRQVCNAGLEAALT